MTPEHKSLVRNSFAALSCDADQCAARFYTRLFALDPSLRAMFHVDMQTQGRKFIAMLDEVIHAMDRLGQVVPAVWQLGKRHGGYGVRAEHYATIETALIETLRESLPATFDAETEAAWRETYALLALTMQQAAAEGAIERPR